MDGLVVGSQIQCISPAAKEVPQIITENGGYPTSPLPAPLLPPTSLYISICFLPKQSLAHGTLRFAKHWE